MFITFQATYYLTQSNNVYNFCSSTASMYRSMRQPADQAWVGLYSTNIRQ